MLLNCHLLDDALLASHCGGGLGFALGLHVVVAGGGSGELSHPEVALWRVKSTSGHFSGLF